jgi:hypothetical protein
MLDDAPLPRTLARQHDARGYVGQALMYVYSRENDAEALQAKVLTADEARRVALNVAKLPGLLRRED